MDKMPLIVAHRGARDEAPENTGAAFDRALVYPVDGLELDVQMSHDGVPVVYHDRTLFRVLKRYGHISDFSLNQLSAMDFGVWFSPKFAGESIPTLRTILSRYIRRTRLYIEIKSRPRDRASGLSSVLTEKVVEEIFQPAFADRLQYLYILSFDPEVLSTASRVAPNLNYVWNLPDKEKELNRAINELQRTPASRGHLFGLCVKVNLLTQTVSRSVHDLGKQLITYTCNGPRQLKAALDMGVDVLMTDKPGRLAALLREDGEP